MGPNDYGSESLNQGHETGHEAAITDDEAFALDAEQMPAGDPGKSQPS